MHVAVGAQAFDKGRLHFRDRMLYAYKRKVRHACRTFLVGLEIVPLEKLFSGDIVSCSNLLNNERALFLYRNLRHTCRRRYPDDKCGIRIVNSSFVGKGSLVGGRRGLWRFILWEKRLFLLCYLCCNYFIFERRYGGFSLATHVSHIY